MKSRGWRIRMRIDPMIRGFDYRGIAEQVRRLAPERVTLGTLRAEHNLPRYVGNGLFKELEKPADPKALARYPMNVRLALYRQATDVLSKVCSPRALRGDAGNVERTGAGRGVEEVQLRPVRESAAERLRRDLEHDRIRCKRR